jgi:hypothetical protein
VEPSFATEAKLSTLFSWWCKQNQRAALPQRLGMTKNVVAERGAKAPLFHENRSITTASVRSAEALRYLKTTSTQSQNPHPSRGDVGSAGDGFSWRDLDGAPAAFERAKSRFLARSRRGAAANGSAMTK